MEAEELLKLDYGYNLASDRLALQTDMAAYTYHLDKSGRLVEETINRWVTQHNEHLAQGEMAQCQLDFENRRVQLLSIADDFSQLNVDRWQPKLQTSTPSFQPWERRFLGNELRAKQGLHMVYPSAWTAFDYPLSKDTSGSSMGPVIRSRIGFRATPALQELRLRTPLVGDFDLVLDWEDSMRAPDGIGQSSPDFNVSPYLAFLQMTVQKLDGTAACYVSRAYNSDPLTYPGTADNNHYRGKYDDDGTIYHPLTTDTVGKFRIKRDGSNLNVYYWNEAGPAWVRLGPGRTSYNTDPLQLVLTGMCEHGCMNYTLLSLTHNDVDPTLFAEEGTYESSLFDAGQTVVWERISWEENLETGTDVEFQVAFSNDVAGPWSYIGPDGTSGTSFTTPAGEDFDATSDFEGRYARFKVILTGDGTETPSFSNVHLSFSGEGLLDSSVLNYNYDEAGNITMVTTVTDAGTDVDDRNPLANPINELNQIIQQDVGGDSWIFSYDDNGNMTGKTNGTDTWTYTWNDDNRLTRVQGPGSVDVSYTYDHAGRLLHRDDGVTSTAFVWEQRDCVKETSSETVILYHIPNGTLKSVSINGEIFQVVLDALNSVRLLTDEVGVVVARLEHSAFGGNLQFQYTRSVLSAFPLRFMGGVGVRTDGLTGLILCGERWYDPTIQRFCSRDPQKSNNRYVYAGNNPTRFFDYNGLQPSDPRWDQQFDRKSVQDYRRLYEKWRRQSVDRTRTYKDGETERGLRPPAPLKGGVDLFCQRLNEISDTCGGNNDEFMFLLQAFFLSQTAAQKYGKDMQVLGIQIHHGPYELALFDTENCQDPQHFQFLPGMNDWQRAYEDRNGSDNTHHLVAFMVMGYLVKDRLAHQAADITDGKSNPGDRALGHLGADMGDELRWNCSEPGMTAKEIESYRKRWIKEVCKSIKH